MSYVLIAEPDPARANLYRNLCADEGYDCAMARDGEHARFFLKSRGLPSLLISELSLPLLDGFALLRELRTRLGSEEVPVIVVSGIRELRNEAVRRKDELGITTLLAKSSPATTVQRAIQNALARLTPLPLAEAAQLEQSAPIDSFAMQAEHAREVRRLARIAAMGLVDDLPPDEGLQRLVKEVAEAFRVPIALVSLVLEDRQWFKAYHGLSGQLLEQRGTPRDISFCRHVVENDQPLVVPDAKIHPYFATNPLVVGGGVRGYAGVPLKTPSGESLGTLCIVDTKPLAITAEELELLQLLARRVAGELELRQYARIASGALAERDRELALLAAVTGHLEDGVMLSDASRRILYASPAIERLTGLAAHQLIGRTRDEWLDALATRLTDPAEASRKLKGPAEGPIAGHEEVELTRPQRRVLRWTGKPVPFGGGWAQLCVYSDVTAERDQAVRLESLALSDALTGLPNRRAAEEALLREAARASRWGIPVSVALIDVDGFRRVNEALGHHSGDMMLKVLARLFGRAVRGGDLVCRWGGDEFLAILPGVDADGARVMAERARRAVDALADPSLKRITISVGLGQLERDESAAAILERAEAALREAKAAGGNRVG